jgi:hydrogenase maturation protein HypF
VALALLEGRGRVGSAGGDAASRALDDMPHERRRLLETILARGVASPVTTSAGRLFDGIAALLGLARRNRWEGEAAVALEEAARAASGGATGRVGGYRFEVTTPEGGEEPRGGPGGVEGGDPRPLQVDWRPVVDELLRDLSRDVEVGTIAARVHAACVEAMVVVARRVGVETVALSGGCFQNRILVEGATRRLREEGFRVLLNRHVPPNDGGIALGQVLVAAARSEAGSVGAEPEEGR